MRQQQDPVSNNTLKHTDSHKCTTAQRSLCTTFSNLISVSIIEVPEEPYDNRPLFERLEEQRLKKEAEYEEAHKLSKKIVLLNMID